jgi:hypothetical protein
MHPDELLRDCPPKLSIVDLAALLGVRRRTVNNWLKRKENPLPGIKFPGGWVIDTEELRAWLLSLHN